MNWISRVYHDRKLAYHLKRATYPRKNWHSYMVEHLMSKN